MKDEKICYCKDVKKSKIINAINEGAKSLKDIKNMTKACTGNQCKELNPKGRCCLVDVIEILKESNLTDTVENCCSCDGDCC